MTRAASSQPGDARIAELLGERTHHLAALDPAGAASWGFLLSRPLPGHAVTALLAAPSGAVRQPGGHPSDE